MKTKIEMDTRLVMALCLPLLLWFVQVKGQPMAASPEGVDGTLVNLDNNTSTAFDPSVSVEEGPLSVTEPAQAQVSEPFVRGNASASQRPGFEVQIRQAISQCRPGTRRPTCGWRRDCTVRSQGLIAEEQISDDICCCACQEAAECQAIHYETLNGTCVFHQGPTLRRDDQNVTVCWFK